MAKSLSSLQEYLLNSKVGKLISSSTLVNNELSIDVKAQDIIKILIFIRDDKNCAFKQLVSICGVDDQKSEARFIVVYNLLSFEHNLRIRIKVATIDQAIVPSATGVFSAAGWYERETWDMYGILFGEHPDLRRILTDYGFEGHPLRKDFPLTGHVEVRYDLEKKKVVYEPVNLSQEFRRFDFLSPWEGTDYILPGDEKATKEK